MEYVFSFFFVPGSVFLDYENASSVIRTNLSQFQFVSPSTYIPLPLDAPAEIPRMQMLRADQTVKMTFSNVKIDIAINNIFLSSNNYGTLGVTRALFHKIINTLMGKLNLEFNRVAIITSSYIKDSEPEKYLSSRLLKISEPVKSLGLNYSTEEFVDEKSINVIKDFQTGFINETRDKIIIIGHEINNHPDSGNLTENTIMSIYDFASNKIDNFTF